MSGEKKSSWRLSTPFRRFHARQDVRRNATGRRSRSRVSSVYLSDGSSTSDFVIVPEFDCPAQPHPIYQEFFWRKPPSPSPSSPGGVDAHLDSTGSHYSCLGHDSRAVSIVDTRTDDLTERLDWAYEHIRSMPVRSATFPRLLLSSDPQMLRKQLGVPQHSVLNHPVHSSTDLPNPHISPPEPVSLDSLPAVVPYTRTLDKRGLCRNRDMTIYSSHRFPAIRPSHSMSVVNTPTLTDNSPSQRNTLWSPRSAHIIRTSKSPFSIPNLSKPAQFRVEKTTSLSSAPSCRQASNGVLRKPCDTLPSANAHGRQVSLPQIRPSSPFEVDIPLHHPWHDRQANFNSSVEYHSKPTQSLDTNSPRTSGSTEALASLVWVGIPHSTNRKCHLACPSSLLDRFSVGIAMEDDSISDDVLVDRLEKARRINGLSEHSINTSPSRSLSSTHFSSGSGHESAFSPVASPPSSPPTSDWLASACDAPLSTSLISKDTASDLEDAIVWQAARKALLCTREIVRTEKRYQEALRMLLNAQTTTPPPPSMAPHVSALVRVSDILLKRFLEDPSAWGISTAFVASEDELEAMMVSWCAIAGAFFTEGNDPQSDGPTGRWRLRKSRGMSSSPSLPATKRNSVSLSPQLPPVFPMTNTVSKRKEWVDEEYCPGQCPHTGAKSPPKFGSMNGWASTGQPPSRKLSVRDLAIQPIQRVMRYVLLYKDLLDCTPATSPPRLLVERALEAATRIASHCDRAQRNPAFCHAS